MNLLTNKNAGSTKPVGFVQGSAQPQKNHKFLSIGKKLQDKEKARLLPVDEIRESVQTNKAFVLFAENKMLWTDEEHDNLKALVDLPKNTNGYYVDIYGQRISYNGNRSLLKPKTEMNLSKVHKNEIAKCASDYKYFRKHYCMITTKTGLARPEPRPYQEKLEDELLTLDDVVILYPRQSGKTVTSGTYLLWLGLFHPHQIMIGIVANKPKTAREVLDKIKKIYLLLPVWMKTGTEVWNKSEIEFENGTRIMTDGPSSDSFRGYTCNIIYVDETAYIKKSLWDEFVDSVMPTMNSLIFKQVIMTSTANGMNHFEQIVKRAKRSDSERFITTSWKNVPHYNKQGRRLTNEEYKKITIRKFGKKYFAQTEECEFLGSSDTLISGEALHAMQNHVDKVETVSQMILNSGFMYHKVEENHSYILTCDPAKDGIDDFSVDVIDVTSFPFVQVFSADLQIDYLMMPEHLNELGIYYNNALIVVENNEGAGQSITDTLWGVYEYENLYRDNNIEGRKGKKKYTGFRTTIRSRPLILGMMKIFLDEEKLIINNQKTLNQLYTFTKKKTGNKYEAEDGYKDDAVMSLSMTFAPFMHIKVFDNFSLFTKELHAEESTARTGEYLSALDIGFSNDEDEDSAQLEQLRLLRLEMQGLDDDYGVGESF